MKTKSYRLRIPSEMAAQLEEILAERKLTVEDMTLLYLRSFLLNAVKDRCMMLHDKMPFGKYQGSSLELIIKSDPNYIVWLLSNSKSFAIEIEAMELLKDVMEG